MKYNKYSSFTWTIIERYEGRAHPSGSPLPTSIGNSTQSPLMEIQEEIPKRMANMSTNNILFTIRFCNQVLELRKFILLSNAATWVEEFMCICWLLTFNHTWSHDQRLFSNHLENLFFNIKGIEEICFVASTLDQEQSRTRRMDRCGWYCF